MGQFIRGRGGVYVATTQRQLNLKTVALLLGGDAERFADTLLDFRERADVFGPYDYYTLINHLRVAVQQNLSQEGCMELLRLSHYDPQIFLEFGRVLLEQASTLGDTQRAELQVALEKVWDNFFPLGKDLPFELARVYLAIRRPREALRFNELSLQMFGEHPVTFCNMGICHYHAEDFANARRYFERSLAHNPEYGLPKAWLARVHAEQDRHQS
jgi:tetratricopeptide (TPR) repeat protein